MLNIAFARLPFRLCVLVLACAAALGGCSVLEGGQTGAPGDEAATHGASPADTPEHDAEPVEQDPVTPEAPVTQDGTPGWNLHTLESGPALAASGTLTLERAWRLAVENDPDYQAAVSGLAASRTEVRQGRAGLLPQVNAGYSRNAITGLQRQRSQGAIRENELDYDATSAYIQLQQPLFNMERYAGFMAGKARVRAGSAEFAVSEAEAALRLAGAYFDTLQALGGRDLARALVVSLETQAHAQDALYQRNEGSRIDAQETHARLALAQARLIATEDDLRIAQRRLQSLLGQAPSGLASLAGLDADRLYLREPLAGWLNRARASAAAISRADAQLQLAEAEMRRALGRHLPTAALVAAYSDADSENLDSLSQRSNTFTVGLQLSIPLFSGGYDTASHARSRHERRRAQHELAQAREQVAAEITRHYTAVAGGAQRIAALMSSVRSSEQGLEAARRGYEYGVNSNLDLLRLQETLFEKRYQLLAARVEVMKARIGLAVAAGEPPAGVFAAADTALN